MKRLLVMLLVPAVITAACGAENKDQNTQVNEQDKTKTTQEGKSTLKIDPKPENDSKVVARVNGVPIYEDELRGKNLQRLINDEVLYQKGLGSGLGEKYAQKVRDYRKHLIVNDMKSELFENAPPEKEISDEEIQTYYDNNPQKYTFVRMQEVGFADKGLGDEILGKMKSGEDLSEIVNAYAESGANVVGRNLGFDREMLQKFDSIELGSVTEVLTKPDGTYSVIKIVEVKPIPLHQAKSSIRTQLEAKRKRQANEEYANQIIEENSIEIEIVN